MQPGYNGNLMGEDQGTLDSQNVADLSSENQPSPYWLNDDDQVRDWVNAHSSSEICALPRASKVAAIKTLSGFPTRIRMQSAKSVEVFWIRQMAGPSGRVVSTSWTFQASDSARKCAFSFHACRELGKIERRLGAHAVFGERCGCQITSPHQGPAKAGPTAKS
jgi:hypothetical protein